MVSFGIQAIERPSYELLEQQGDLEIRVYPRLVVAETTVSGEFTKVGGQAFKRLGGYIFGNNASDEKIAMTAPVTQTGVDGGYIVRFFMPANYDLTSLPKPTDRDVKITELPEQTVAVLRYKGGWSKAGYDKHEKLLLQGLNKLKDWQQAGQPVWARYNSPMMPSFMRSNEVMVPVKRINK